MGLGRGGFGGAANGAAGGRDFNNDVYADYNGGGGAGANGAGAMQVDQAEPNQQIYVRNVSDSESYNRGAGANGQLPWATSNDDLVELFETVGTVVAAEMLMDGQRSRGEGVVQFQATEQAQTAGEKFTGYSYGGRPLGECSRDGVGAIRR